jgi:hypothetical protein
MNLPPDIEVTLFDAARQMEDGDARNAFLEWAFRDSPEDGQRMKELLASEAPAQAWFSNASVTRSRLSGEIVKLGRVDMPDESLGMGGVFELPETISERFRIIDRLGEGGGGIVFRAEQTDPVQRRVAIKLLHAGMDSPAFLAAFQHESQTLAVMNHPNIAAVLDAGTTSTGRPYLVMELVEGETITRFCDGLRLTIRQRLDVFLQVCSAIQHAHQKGIIHRDIKPSNILVSTADSTPRPKVIDFGIASAIAAENSTDALTAGTPAYMSPEQSDAGAIDIDTRADVFSLGVLLYELLVGEVPWKPGSLPADAARPSAHVAIRPAGSLTRLAGLRHLQPSGLATSLRGDLDSIVMKALARNRQQRYDSVAALAEDIQRFLEIQPVLAHPPGRRYVLKKFFLRNRLTCLSGLVVLAILAGGAALVIGTLVREQEARRESDAARATIAKMLAQSKARETVAEIAILLSDNRIEDADALLRLNPLTGVEPSMDATHVFRFLGERNALLGRWRQAADCFILLMQANQLANAQKVAEGMDLLFAAPTALEAGDADAYDSLRREILFRLPTTTDLIAAEHVVKSCLLDDVEPDVFKKLRPMAELLRQNIDSENLRTYSNIETRPWMAMALATFDFRDGRFEEALEWCRKCEEMPKSIPSRTAGVKMIAAMANHRLGRHSEAQEEFAKSARMIDAANPRVIVRKVESYDPSQGTWYAWAVARVLRREAEEAMRVP